MTNHDFFQETSEGQWKGIAYLIPRPEIQLIYYLLHATCQHQWMRFVHIVNIVHFIQKFQRLDWQQVYTLAAARKALSPLHYGLKFVQAFFPLPDQARDLLKQSTPGPATRLMASALSPQAILAGTNRRGKFRRNLFRAAISL